MSIVPRCDRLTPTEAAQLLGVNVCTVWRWMLSGARGRKLSSLIYGGRRFISRGDLDLFLAQDSPRVTHSDADYLRRAEDAGRQLDGMGVTAKAKTSASPPHTNRAS